MSDLERPNAFVPVYACMPKGGLKGYTGLKDQRIHCTAGTLWVTLQGDAVDHVLQAGEHLEIPDEGKVLVSGPGCYRISRDIDGLDLIAA